MAEGVASLKHKIFKQIIHICPGNYQEWKCTVAKGMEGGASLIPENHSKIIQVSWQTQLYSALLYEHTETLYHNGSIYWKH